MKYLPSHVKEDCTCPYCMAVVVAGTSECVACGARHVIRRRTLIMGGLFFLAGLWIGRDAFAMGMIATGLVIALVGGFVLDKLDRKRPLWILRDR